MKGSNINFLLGWFIVGFGIAYVMFNITNFGNEQNGYTDIASIYEKSLANVELRQNSYTSNYVRIPTYTRSASRSYCSKPPTINESEKTENESSITAEYTIKMYNESKNTINKSNIGYNTSNYLGESKSQIYSSQKNENNTNSNSYSGLSEAINQLTALNNEKPIKIIQGSNENVKSNHGFLTLNTNLTAINSSMSMTENSMQKVGGEGNPGDPGYIGNSIDPGAGGDMGSPIPVGDGWIFMFMLALVYGGFKGFVFRV
ncbi:MAG: hypothetical protein WCG93_10665 [Paludibacter sp.]